MQDLVHVFKDLYPVQFACRHAASLDHYNMRTPTGNIPSVPLTFHSSTGVVLGPASKDTHQGMSVFGVLAYHACQSAQ